MMELQYVSKIIKQNCKKKSRRMAVLRQKIKERPNTPSKIFSLFQKIKSIEIITILPILPP
jgi:hypothetical protein